MRSRRSGSWALGYVTMGLYIHIRVILVGGSQKHNTTGKNAMWQIFSVNIFYLA